MHINFIVHIAIKYNSVLELMFPHLALLGYDEQIKL